MSEDTRVSGRDLLILERIIKYADEVGEAMSAYNNDFEAVSSNSVARNAIAMCILQIGELVGHLRYEVIDRYQEIPWKRIRAMRNIAAHDYESFNMDLMWDVATTHIPELKGFCEKIIKERA